MNAIIMAAGTSSRFVPLSVERPKGLLEVKGEILIERQIHQLQEAGVDDITIVTGYKAAMFDYLRNKYGVDTVNNEDFNRYNNTSSIICVLDRLNDTFICCSDHYFKNNVFLEPANESYYAARYAKGVTGEYCLSYDDKDFITEVSIGGRDAWYMAGHAFFAKPFSAKFRDIMLKEYAKESVRNGYWEDVYISHIKELPMQIRRYSDEDIFEFDTLDELRVFDESYMEDSRSKIVKQICRFISCKDSELYGFQKIKHEGDHLQFTFFYKDDKYIYDNLNPLKINQQ